MLRSLFRIPSFWRDLRAIRRATYPQRLIRKSLYRRVSRIR
jgi:hypothetical protein